jgi:methanogenic corrinoid protein MtbC1
MMALPDEEIHELILNLVLKPHAEDLYDVYINSLIGAMLSFDEPLFDKVFSNVFLRFGVYDTMLKIVYPFLRKTGVLWSTRNATPAQEHFASNILKRKLFAAIDGIPFSRNKSKKFLLFLPPGEWHEIGFLFSDFMIRSAGVETLYLGQNVPYSSLETTIELSKPDHLLTFFTAGVDFSAHLKVLVEVSRKNPDITVLIGSNMQSSTIDLPANVKLLHDPQQLSGYLQ